MPKKPSKPHDEFFKATFGRQEVALDYLKKMLPSGVLEHLNLSKLERINGAFVSPALREFFSDIAYQCPTDIKRQPVMVSFIFEHKSSPESRPHLQLLRYMLDAWDEQLKQKKDLTLIIPILIYHGEENWHQRDMSSYFGDSIPEEFLAYLPSFDYIFTNVTAMNNAQILALGEGLLVNAFLMLKHIHHPAYIIENPQLIFINLAPPQSPQDFIIVLFAYFLKNTELAQEKIQNFIRTLPAALNQTVMSTYEMILEEGRKEGRLMLEQLVAEERQRTQDEHQRAQEEHQRAQEAIRREEEERRRAEEEYLRAEEERRHLDQVIIHLHKVVQLPIAEIAALTARDASYIEALLHGKQ